MNFTKVDNGAVNLGFAVRGTREVVNFKICWQAHDEYYDCIEKQTPTGDIENVNKFLCMNQLYLYEMHCPTDFIKARKFNFYRQMKDKNYWTEDQLELINYHKNGWTMDSVVDDGSKFEDTQLNSLLFKHF